MIFCRSLLLIALLFTASACTAGNDLPKATTVVASFPQASGVPVLPPSVERDVGAAYPDAEL